MKANPNLTHLINNYRRKVTDKQGITTSTNCCLEGSSRSGKTWSGVDFLLWYTSRNSGKSINIIRETYNSFKTTLYGDFQRRLSQFNVYNPFGSVKEISTFALWDNTVNLLGADKPEKFEGAGCDIAWFNEMLEVPKMIFDLQEQRCREFWFGDWNPKRTDHWAFDLEKRNDVAFLRTTFTDNPFISPAEKKKITGYEPTPENITNGTADDYMWKVYGQGIRACMEGLIFANVTYIDAFPENIEQITYGMDFGQTQSPTAVVKIGISGRDLFLENLFYQPTPEPEVLLEVLKKIVPCEQIIWSDSENPELIAYLRRRGVMSIGARKPAGSIQYGIGLIKQYRINIIRNLDFKKEQENYKWRTIGGIALNEPVDDHNHLWDATRYGVTMKVRQTGM